eukprot:5666244-Pyramimonas_sp.AAC.1
MPICPYPYPYTYAHIHIHIQHASDRPDIVARVFRWKGSALLADIVEKETFGKVQAYLTIFPHPCHNPPAPVPPFPPVALRIGMVALIGGPLRRACSATLNARLEVRTQEQQN